MMREFLHLDAFAIKKNFLILIFFIVTGCDKLNESSDPEPDKDLSSMSFNRTDLRPLQIASVTFRDAIISEDSYTGNFGGMEIPLKKVNSSTLAFMVPEHVEPGLKNLDVTINNNSFQASISILENIPLSDPAMEFESIYEELLNDDLFNGINIGALQMARQEFYNLSEDEQRQAAQMLVNNNSVYEQLEAELKNFRATAFEGGRLASFTCGDKCMVVVGGAVAVVTAAMSAPIAAVGLGIFIGSILEPVVKILKEKFQALIKEVNLGLELAFGLGYNRMAKPTELVYDKYNNMINNRISALPDTIYLKEDEALNLSLKLYKTPLISELNRGSFYLVDQLLDLIYALQEKLTNVYSITSPPDEIIKEYTDDLEKFTLSSDNENIVIDGLYGTPEEAQVFFTTGEAYDQAFNLIIGYEDENSELTETKLTLKLETYELKKYLMLNGNSIWGYGYETNTERFETYYFFKDHFRLDYYREYEDYTVVCYGNCLPVTKEYNWQVLDESTILIAGFTYDDSYWYQIWTITERTNNHFKYTICEDYGNDQYPQECFEEEHTLYENF